MASRKTELEKAAGKLILAIQKEWGNELGESVAEVSEDVMNKGHELLLASKQREVHCVLGGLNVTQYLGELWVSRHPEVKKFIVQFERELEENESV
ncbi:hypothetical protein [Marinobacterium marinum]|uniref:Uncharacterized protein n=1 Tax=Marinobacterium marinum TaxID=2756129 RepID=A0A7W1WWY6_9GAMM|nr:hypothetical protein [Marinobacterium marinum]MBA4501698.1 hypothetical protein [Marinobacterium marinum]